MKSKVNEIFQEMKKYQMAYSILIKKLRKKKLCRKMTEKIENVKKVSGNEKLKATHLDGNGGYSNPEAQNNEQSQENNYDSDSEIESQIKEKRDKPTEIPNTFPCDICGSFFRAASNLDLHKKLHTLSEKNRQKWSCSHCLYNFSTKKSLITHKCKSRSESNDGHSSDEITECLEDLFSCTECYAVYRKAEDLEKHKKANHFTHHVCNICSKSFMFKVALDRHSFIHLKTKEFHCKLCSKVCKSEKDLKNHNVVHGRDILNVALSALNTDENLVSKLEKKSTEKKLNLLECKVQLGSRVKVNDSRSLTVIKTVKKDKKSTKTVKKPKNLKKATQSQSKSSSRKINNPVTQSSIKTKFGCLPPEVTSNLKPVVKILKLNIPDAETQGTSSPIQMPQQLQINLSDNKPKCQLCYETFNTQEALLDHIEIHLGRKIQLGRKNNPTINSQVPESLTCNLSSLPVPEEAWQNPFELSSQDDPTSNSQIHESLTSNLSAPSAPEEAWENRFELCSQDNPTTNSQIHESLVSNLSSLPTPQEAWENPFELRSQFNPVTNPQIYNKKNKYFKPTPVTESISQPSKTYSGNNRKRTLEKPQEPLFDPTYIIKVEPLDNSNTCLDSIFVRVMKRKKTSYIKASEYMKNFKEVRINLF